MRAPSSGLLSVQTWRRRAMRALSSGLLSVMAWRRRACYQAATHGLELQCARLPAVLGSWKRRVHVVGISHEDAVCWLQAMIEGLGILLTKMTAPPPAPPPALDGMVGAPQPGGPSWE